MSGRPEVAAPAADAAAPGASWTYLDYARRGKTQWWRYPCAVAAGLAIALAIGVATIFAFNVLHLLPADIAGELTRPTHPLIFFFAAGLNFAVLLAGLLAGIALIHKKTLADLMGRWSWPVFAAGVGVWLAVLAVSTAIDLAVAPAGFRFSPTSATALLAICAGLALPIQTFAEEVVFRGYLTQGLLLATRRPALAAALAGLMFGALHIPNGIPQAVGATAFGVATSLIAIRLGGIAFTFGLHLINNLFSAVVVVSSGDVFAGAPGLVTQNTPRLTWWDIAVEMLALTLVVWLVVRRAR